MCGALACKTHSLPRYLSKRAEMAGVGADARTVIRVHSVLRDMHKLCVTWFAMCIAACACTHRTSPSPCNQLASFPPQLAQLD